MQASAAAPQPLITQVVDETRLTRLTGNTHPLARPENDLGTAPATLPMQRMLLVLKRSPDQEAALAQLLDDQQDKSSPNYHKWLSPEEFGSQFGPTDADMQTITTWLQSHGFQVGSTKGRTVLEFSGSASQVQEAFHTTIHKYLVDGEQHWANASDPSIPTALTPAIAGVASLNNFQKKAMNRFVGRYSEKDKQLIKAEPNYTFSCGSGVSCYALVPYDFAAIYDVLPLWNATSPINGTGQTIAIVGRTNINPTDPATFWQLFGLTVPQNKLVVTLNGPDPGIIGDEAEADIDIQWSGAVAPQATINFVTSQTTETTDGIDLSAVYIVENNLAPVMSESYGLCELGLGTAGNQFEAALWGQAAAQGITVLVSSGDNGSAGCDNPGGPAQYGLNVNGNASTPYNVAVGGTDFNQYNTWTTYWNSTNNSTTQQSAKGYIPETTWNDSCTNALAITLGYGTTAEQACNNSQMIAAGGVNSTGGSGGPSNCTVNTGLLGSCTQGYSKPSWQTGTGVPADGKRDLPDVSLFASNGFLGSFYVICQSDATGGVCDLNNFAGYGGTSVSSPAFAGIMALVNQKTGERQGNANYVLYKLAAQQPTAFHDVPSSSTIAMPCISGTPNCQVTTTGDSYGILTGYSTTTAYDLATGLGSVDANNLVTKWTSVNLLASTTTLNSLTPTTLTHGQSVTIKASVAPKTGTGTPTGQIALLGSPTKSTQGIAAFSLTSGSASGSTDLLPGGSYAVTAHYPGDATYASSDSGPINVTVNPENSQTQAFLVTFDWNGYLINGNTNTAVYGSPYLLRVNVENSAGQMCVPTPLATTTTPATGCPTGEITLTDNGSPLDAGTYTLNSYGYFEDQTVQLPGGSNSVQAAYAGDNSFNASSATAPLSITAAPTTIGYPNVSNSTVGSQLTANVLVQAQSNGVAPTGTVSFLVNGTSVAGTATYQGTGGSASSPSATLTAYFTSSGPAFPNAGNYTITASYSGDANYGSSSSGPTTVTVQYPTPTVLLTPANQTVSSGSNATVTALVDTTNKTVAPTGTVTFTNWYTGAFLSGPTACTSVTDSSGNYACQAAGTFAVTSTLQVLVQYSGDTNYPASSAMTLISVPDFTIGVNTGAVTVSQGQSQQVTINIAAQNGFAGTVGNFTCSGLPAEATFSFSPTQVSGSGATTLTITAAALGQMRHRAANQHRGFGWMATALLPLLGICLLGLPAWRRSRGLVPALLVLALFVSVTSCGGGGGGGVTNNPVPAISSISPTQQAAGSNSQTLTINGSGFISGSSVTYNGVAHSVTSTSASQLAITLSASDMATTGSYPVVVTNPTPGGGASAPVNFNVVTGTPTGSFTVTVGASSGTLSHTTSFTLTVQ